MLESKLLISGPISNSISGFLCHQIAHNPHRRQSQAQMTFRSLPLRVWLIGSRYFNKNNSYMCDPALSKPLTWVNTFKFELLFLIYFTPEKNGAEEFDDSLKAGQPINEFSRQAWTSIPGPQTCTFPTELLRLPWFYFYFFLICIQPRSVLKALKKFLANRNLYSVLQRPQLPLWPITLLDLLWWTVSMR